MAAVVGLSAIVVLAIVLGYLLMIRGQHRPTVPVEHRRVDHSEEEQASDGADTQPAGAARPDWHVLPPAEDTTLHPAHVGGKVGFIDHTGQLVIPAKFTDGRPFDGPRGPACEGRRWGLIDRTGEWVVSPEPGRPPVFQEDRAPVFGLGEGGRYCGYVDLSNQMVIPARFEDCRPFREGLAAAKQNGKWGFLGPAGVWFIEPQYDFARNYSDAKAAVWMTGRMGFLNRAGKVVIEPVFTVSADESDYCDFHDNRAAAKRAEDPGKWGYIDREGRWMIQPRFDAARPFSEGLAAVKLDGKWGFIDDGGKMVIAPGFTEVDPAGLPNEDYRGGFHGGRAAVATAPQQWGFIDTAGTWMTKTRYKQVQSFRGKLAEVVTDDGAGYINRAGQVVFKPVK